MYPVRDGITGKEQQGDWSSPYHALVQFYCAFNSRDVHMMSENWAQADDISMDNPLGGIKRGWDEIRSVYERIFAGPAEVHVEFFDYTIHETPEMFFAVGRERGYFRVGSKDITLAIRTSRIFQKRGGRWRQVHHHGSIDDPQSLTEYQSAVVGRTP